MKVERVGGERKGGREQADKKQRNNKKKESKKKEMTSSSSSVRSEERIRGIKVSLVSVDVDGTYMCLCT